MTVSRVVQLLRVGDVELAEPGFRTPFSSPVWIACLACFFRPIRSASWKMIGRRSRTTWPFWLETTWLFPSRIETSWVWATRLACCQSL